MESFILFFEKCRLCLNQSGVYNMFESKGFPDDIFLCTGIKVQLSDNLPQRLCKRCFKVVKNATSLRVLALKNNTHLKTLIDAGSADKINKTPENVEDVTSTNITKTQEIMKQNNGNQAVSTSSIKIISVRKDIFESSSTVSSSEERKITTYDEEPQKDDISSCKKIKFEDDATIFECTVCLKKFDRWKKLYLHKRLHNKNVLCPLDTCDKSFSSKGDLEKHFRTHTGEKPYKCNLCERSFSQRVTLKLHREKLHDIDLSSSEERKITTCKEEPQKDDISSCKKIKFEDDATIFECTDKDAND